MEMGSGSRDPEVLDAMSASMALLRRSGEDRKSCPRFRREHGGGVLRRRPVEVEEVMRR
jgi:hypothetical protein